MKTKLLLLLLLLAFKLPASSQNKVVKYCTITYEYSSAFNIAKIKPTLHLGVVDSLFKPIDANLKNQLQKVLTLNTETDVLNYMSYLGWTLISVYSQHFYFKKEFDPSELKTSKAQ